jgi:hypothetical protein
MTGCAPESRSPSGHRWTFSILALAPASTKYSKDDQIRILVDGLTAANQLGLTDAVPPRDGIDDGRVHEHRASLTLAARFIARRPDQNPEAAAVHHFRSEARSRNPPGSCGRHPHTAHLDAGPYPQRDCSPDSSNGASKMPANKS